MPTIHKDHPLGTMSMDDQAYGHSWRFFFQGQGHDTIEVDVPDTLDADSAELARGCTIIMRTSYGGESVEEMRKYEALLGWALAFCEEENAKMADLVDAAKAKEAELRAEQERKREERAKVLAERKERLLTEFLEEKGRVRLAGYKKWRPVIVKAREVVEPDGSSSYHPFLEYVFERHGYREHNIDQWRSFEIKVGSRFQSVWEDGQGDLSTWDQVDRKPVQPYDGALG